MKAMRTAPKKSFAQNPPLILVIEPDTALRALFEGMLTNEGYQVIVASGGHTALASLAVHAVTPDLVIIDAFLPLLSAEAVVTTLRQSCGHSLPILALSTDSRAA